MAKNNTKFKKYSIPLLLLSLVVITVYSVYVLLSGYGIRISYPSMTIYKQGINPKPSNIPDYNLLDTRNWNRYVSTTGEISFSHPPDTTVQESEGNISLFLIDPETKMLSSYYIAISAYRGNLYNRPPEEFFIQYNFPANDISSAERTVVNGHPAILFYDEERANTSILIEEMKYGITLRSHHSITFPEVNPYLSDYVTLLNSLTITPLEANTIFKIKDGNIYVRENGRLHQLTNSGYDINPVASPNGKKVVYLSEIDTLNINCDSPEDYSCDSDQVFDIFLIDSNGKNKIKLTESKTLIDHEILKWLDNDTILYREGDTSIRTYTISANTHTTIAGPNEAENQCFDFQCQNNYTYEWSNNGRYYFIFRNGGKDERVVLLVDSKTLEGVDLDESNTFKYCSNYAIQDTVFTFTCDNSPPWVDGSKREYPVKALTSFRYDMASKKMIQISIEEQFNSDTL